VDGGDDGDEDDEAPVREGPVRTDLDIQDFKIVHRLMT
jgi:hypothetical protein